MTDQRCPFCGIELKEGGNGELFCPNHGIIIGGKRSFEKGTPPYCR